MLPRLIRASAVLFGFGVLMIFDWTTGNEVLSGADPRKTLSSGTPPCPATNDCAPLIDGADLHWVSRTENGDLYLLVRGDCPDGESCGAWFVERTPRGMAARLNIDGQFRMLHSGKSVPDVQVWHPLSENKFEVTRYSWLSGSFQRVEYRTVYIVDGEECGNALDCYLKAQAAHRQRHTGRALRIWEKVHNVSFI